MTFPFPMLVPQLAPPPDPTISYRTTVSSSFSASTTVSYAAVDIGTAGATRTVIVYIGVVSNASAAQVSGVTIGGIAATAAVNTGVASQWNASIWTADVPTGTTATIAITASAAIASAMVSVWAAYDLTSTTPTDTAAVTGTATTHTLDLDLAAKGLAVAGRISAVSSGSRTHTWSGGTERVETTINANNYGSAADYAATTAEAPHGLSVTTSGAVIASASVSASFR